MINKQNFIEKNKVLYYAGFFLLLGLFLLKYNYFVEDKKYLFFKKIFGEKGVKIFYYLFGLFFVWLGYIFLR